MKTKTSPYSWQQSSGPICLSVCKNPDILYITSSPQLCPPVEILHIQTVLRVCGAVGSMLTVCSYVFHWEVVNMRHVADSGEDHKASQDARQWVGDCYNQSIPGKEGEHFPARFKKLKTPETNKINKLSVCQRKGIVHSGNTSKMCQFTVSGLFSAILSTCESQRFLQREFGIFSFINQTIWAQKCHKSVNNCDNDDFFFFYITKY